MDSNASQPIPFFVYGTLIPGQPNSYLWGDSIVSVKPAVFEGGILYDMGFFPMMLEEKGGSVRGVVIKIAETAYDEILTRLDHLEGYSPEEPKKSTYKRLEKLVRFADGTSQLAWLYVGRKTLTEGSPIVPNGDWVTYSNGNTAEMSQWWTSINSVFGYADE